MSQIVKYNSNTILFAHSWSVRNDQKMRLAACSCDNSTNNYVEII